jgi:flagellar biosynthesis/type III secretory pathway M-ring protein FliF/YscJ
MRPTPTNSFFRFVVGFLVFICLFFGVTIVVQKISTGQQAAQQAAAAEAVMLK